MPSLDGREELYGGLLKWIQTKDNLDFIKSTDYTVDIPEDLPEAVVKVGETFLLMHHIYDAFTIKRDFDQCPCCGCDWERDDDNEIIEGSGTGPWFVRDGAQLSATFPHR